LPNAGKSTLITAVLGRAAEDRDYPFTTLYPESRSSSACSNQRSFVMADIPVLIEGAPMVAGSASVSSRHLQRTRVLLHLVDIAPRIRPPIRCAMRCPSSASSASSAKTC
jgi:GTP-binding protein